MSLRRRLTLLFVLGTVLVGAVSTVAALSIVHLTDTRRVLLTQIDPASLSADQLFEAYLDQETGIRGYILSRNTAFLGPYLTGIHDQQAAATRLASDLRTHPQLLTMAHRADAAGHAWNTSFAIPAVLSTRSGDPLRIQQELLGPGKAAFDTVRQRFDALDAALADERVSTGAALSDATTGLIVALAVGLVLLMVAGFAVERSLRRWVVEPLGGLGASVRRVAGGELAHTVAGDGPPEIRTVGTDVEAMRLRIVNELDQVATARADLDDRNRDLQRSNEELEQFAYVASHDLQEPLRKVTSFVQLLQQRYEHQLDPRADEYIGFAVDGARRMQALIDDLLTFSRVGRTPEGFTAVAMGESAEAALASLSGLVAETGATVRIGPLPTVRGDRVLLTSLWQNLLGNAVKFGDGGPPQVAVDAHRDGPFWRFEVTDNGIGIEPRHADRVFVIFQRLHARDAYGGTGIGLALCRKTVEFHGGAIWVDRGYTGGARLCFTLPATVGEGTR
jgi:signal transduction histidine kinase